MRPAAALGRVPLIVPFHNREALLFPLVASLWRAYIDPADVYLCADAGSADWINRKIRERYPALNVLEFPTLDPPAGPVANKPWAKAQWHCVRSVNRVLELCGWPPAFFYVESDCLVARSAFQRLRFLWEYYHRVGNWLPLARIGAYRGRAWQAHRTYQFAPFEGRDWVEDINGGCWFGILNGELWRQIMVHGQGRDGPYDPRRAECDFADSFFDRNCQFRAARFLRTTQTLIQHQGMVDCLNPDHDPVADFVGEQA